MAEYIPMECQCPVCDHNGQQVVVQLSIVDGLGYCADESQVEGQCPQCGFVCSFSLDAFVP